jgi:SMODS and SLOG-associating 2TM effector domain 1
VADRDQQAAEAYRHYRADHQRAWYADRVKEFGTALRQLGVASTALLAASSALGVLGGTSLDGAEWLAASGTIASAIATAITAYTALQAYERLQKSYADSADALDALVGASATGPLGYVAGAEDVMRVEQGQWGQVIAELPDAEPPGP